MPLFLFIFHFFITYIHSFNHNTFIRRHSLKPLFISSYPSGSDSFKTIVCKSLNDHLVLLHACFNIFLRYYPGSSEMEGIQKYRFLCYLQCLMNSCLYRKISRWTWGSGTGTRPSLCPRTTGAPPPPPFLRKGLKHITVKNVLCSNI
jgi:hypothetical protein